MIIFTKSHPVKQAMSGAARPVDLNEGDIRRNPGEPNAAQSASSEYSKPRVQWQGLTIAIENPAGSVRRGRNRDGVTWEVRMRFDYGEIVGTLGVDGDPIDVIMGPDLDAPMVYVVHQRRVNDWENYDEDKCCVGFSSQSDAEQAFLSNYNDPRFLGPVTALPVAEFVSKVRATREAPAMIKAVLFFKAHVGAYLRGGKMVNVMGYQGRNAHAVAAPGQMSLFGGPMSGKPLPPSPLQDKDAVAHTPDLFAEPERVAPPTAAVTVASRKRIKDDDIGTYTELTLSTGKVLRIQRLNSTESMGLPGWHNIDGNDMDSPTSITWIADTEQDAIAELVSMGNKSAPKAAPSTHPTETHEFKAWFGDSKVVDGSGKPLVVYHGTADDFSEFKHGHANKKDNGWLGQGFYFTNDTEISNSYTNLKAGASPNVMPVYLQLKNPYQATLRDKEFLMLAERRGDKDAAGKWTSELEAKGHDGVILSYGHIQNGDYPAEYVVFKPTQIKSATGNNGRFDPGSADITKSLPVVFLAQR